MRSRKDNPPTLDKSSKIVNTMFISTVHHTVHINSIGKTWRGGAIEPCKCTLLWAPKAICVIIYYYAGAQSLHIIVILLQFSHTHTYTQPQYLAIVV